MPLLPPKVNLPHRKPMASSPFDLGRTCCQKPSIANGENFTENFTTSFDATTYVGTFTMKENTEMNRLMLGRLLIMCGVEVVEFEGNQLPVYQFSNEQLK